LGGAFALMYDMAGNWLDEVQTLEDGSFEFAPWFVGEYQILVFEDYHKKKEVVYSSEEATSAVTAVMEME